MPALAKLHCAPLPNPRTVKLLVTAKYADVDLDVLPNFQFSVTNRTPEFLLKFPFGKVPTAEIAGAGPLYESDAIVYYVALHKPELLGSSFYEKALVQQYMSMVNCELNPPLAQWCYPLLGYAPYDEAAVKRGQESAHKVLRILDQILAPRTFLVGERLTLADITLACALILAYKNVLDGPARAPYVNLNRWFVTIINQPKFKAVLGDTSLVEKAIQYDPTKSAHAAVKKEEPKTAAAAAAAVPKKKATNDDDDDDLDFEMPEKPKEKNPLDLLPPSKFNLEDWKRFYSNNDARPTAIDYFWKNFDPAGFSIWRINYKYNDELTKLFMSSNLIGGLFQRMERLRKYCFGSVLLFGQDNQNEISGFLIFRGLEIPFEMKDVADFESYEFTRMDLEDSKQRELFNDYLAWDGELEGKVFADGKVFK